MRDALRVCSLAIVAACGGGDGFVARPDSAVTVSFSPPTLTVSQGAAGLLAVSISGGNPDAPPTLSVCSSATTAIASVVKQGSGCRITGVAPGSTTCLLYTSPSPRD